MAESAAAKDLYIKKNYEITALPPYCNGSSAPVSNNNGSLTASGFGAL